MLKVKGTFEQEIETEVKVRAKSSLLWVHFDCSSCLSYLAGFSTLFGLTAHFDLFCGVYGVCCAKQQARLGG